jgi:hypothetical protein
MPAQQQGQRQQGLPGMFSVEEIMHMAGGVALDTPSSVGTPSTGGTSSSSGTAGSGNATGSSGVTPGELGTGECWQGAGTASNSAQDVHVQ